MQFYQLRTVKIITRLFSKAFSLLLLMLGANGAMLLGWPVVQASPPLKVESSIQGPVSGFELYQNGLYWWNTGNPRSEVQAAVLGQVGIKTLVAARFLAHNNTATVFSVQSDSVRAPWQSAARTETSLFYFGDFGGGQRIYRRPIFGAASTDPGKDFSGINYQEVGSVLVEGSELYWSARGGAAAADGQVWLKSLAGGAGSVGVLSLGTGVGLVKKMQIVTVLKQDGTIFRSYLYFLNTAGQVWRIGLSSFGFPLISAPSMLAYGVTDFDTRQESTLVVSPIGFHLVNATRLYAATGVNLGSDRLSGRVVSFNLTDGTSSNFYDSQDVNLQITGVVLDSDRIFITRTPLRFNQGTFSGWSYDKANAQLLRKNHPAGGSLVTDPGFVSIAVLQEGGNLRSDGRWLYYTHQNEIRKITTEAPALALDYRAVGLEAIQAVQDFNNSVKLVAGKPTLVRAYAQLLQNTTGLSAFRLAGRLRAFIGAAQLPGEAWSQNVPLIDGSADLATLRGDLNRSFLFDLPAEWLNREGAVRLEFTVNPNGTVPETGETPLQNNTASSSVTVIHRIEPCLVFNVMSSTFPNYDPGAADSLFGDIVDRALSLLPVPGFKLWIRSGSITKPELTSLGVKGRSFTMPDDQDFALNLLVAGRLLSSDPPGCSDTHWVGMFPTEVTKFNGVGNTRDATFGTTFGNALVMRMGANLAGYQGGPQGGFSLAHELSHNFGRNHISTPTNCATQIPASPYDSFVGNLCTLGVTTNLTDAAAPIGYDYRTGTLILPWKAADLMTYATNTWITPQTWQRNIDSIPGDAAKAASIKHKVFASAQPSDGPVFFVQGLLNSASDSGILFPLIKGGPGDFDASKIDDSISASQALAADSPYRLHLLNAANELVVDMAAVPTGYTDGPSEHRQLSQFVPLDPTVVRLQLLSKGRVLAERAASPHAPALILAAPVVDSVNQMLSLGWSASDADSETLFFTVQFTDDDGVTWQTLAIHEPASGVAVSTKFLGEGDKCRMRVLASDGFLSTMEMTSTFAMPKQAPLITLAGLRDGQKLPYGTNLLVRGFAYDAEEGSLDASSIHWLLSGPESRAGVGNAFGMLNLAPGDYVLDVSCADSDGNIGRTSMLFGILPLVVRDSATPVLDGLCADVGYATASAVRLAPDLPEPSVHFVHAGGALYVCFNGLRRSDDGTSPASINFYVNADGAPDASPQADDYGFGVDENGVPYESRGDGVGLAAQLPQDFSVNIMQNIDTWSAEFLVPEALIGGWNHDAKLTILYLRNTCLSIPLVGCLEVADPAVAWPTASSVYRPASWASARFGSPAALSNLAPVAVTSGLGVVAVSEPRTVGLNGAGSYDLNGDALSYRWLQTGGPAITLNDSAAITPSFVTPSLASAATVTFQLIVNDSQIDSVPAVVSLTIVPVGPAAQSENGANATTAMNPDGSAKVQLRWPGPVGDRGVIQGSTDLVSWISLATNTVTFLNALLDVDLEAASYPFRFYRAVSSGADVPSTAGMALEFDGGVSRVEVPHEAALNPFPFTASFWMRSSDEGLQAHGLVSKYVDASFNGYSVFLSEGKVHGWFFGDGLNHLYDGGLGFDGGYVADGQWHHIALVAAPEGGRLLVDGSTVSSLSWTGLPAGPTTSAPLQFGRYASYGEGLIGSLDEVAIWNRALTDAEVQTVMHHALTGAEPGLVGCWPFDESQGLFATDITSHNHDGTLYDGPVRVESSAPLYP